MEAIRFSPLHGSKKQQLKQYETQLDEMVEKTLAGKVVCLTDLLANRDRLARRYK